MNEYRSNVKFYTDVLDFELRKNWCVIRRKTVNLDGLNMREIFVHDVVTVSYTHLFFMPSMTKDMGSAKRLGSLL